jgi:hypothetical protein
VNEQTIQCADRSVLACSCGERVILIGRIEDWYAEERLSFPCACGKRLTFADSLPQDATLFRIFRRE